MRPLEVIVTGNIAGLRNALRAGRLEVQNFNKEVQQSASKRAAINDLGTAFGKVGLVAAAGIAVGVRSYANFDEAMSHVVATGQDAVNNQVALRKAAIDAGAATTYSAGESAGAIEELLKAGVGAKDVLGGGLKGALDLAAAGSMDVAEAGNIAATTMTQFGLKGRDVTHIADLLAAAAGKAQGEVSDMGQALKYVGPIASQMGVSLEETTGTIALLASNGILADQAGTSMRGMLLALTSPSKIASDTMKKLGINVYDAQGKFIGFEGVAGQLQDRMSGLTAAQRDEAFGRIFGNEQITAARVLYKGGADAVADWTDKVNDSGYANDVAGKKLDNLKGDWEKFTGALNTAFIGMGEQADGPIRDLLQNATDLVDAFAELPDWVQSGIVKTLALTAALGAGAFVVSRTITGYANMRNTLLDLGLAQEKVTARQMALRGALVLGGTALIGFSGEANKAHDGLGDLMQIVGGAGIGFAIGGPVGLAAGALGGLAAAASSTKEPFDSGRASAEEYATTLEGLEAKATAATRALAFKDLSSTTNAIPAGRALGLNSRDLVGFVTGDAGAIERVNKALAKYKELVGTGKVPMITLENGGKVDAYNALIQSLGLVGDEFKDAQEAAQEAAAATSTWDEVLKGLPKDARVELENLNYQPTKSQIDELIRKYKLTPDQVKTLMKALDESSKVIKRIQTARDALRDKVITITTYKDTISRSYTDKGIGPKRSLKDMLSSDADGGVYRFSNGIRVRSFADGGIEDHSAQIVKGGSYRVFGEDETFGETYIPHAESKRERATRIFEETGRIIKHPYFVDSYADGGVRGGGSTGGRSGSTGDPVEQALSNFVHGLASLPWNRSNDGRALQLLIKEIP